MTLSATAPSPLLRAKLCGLSNAATIAAAVDSGAAYLGFVFFAKSPRNVSPVQARELITAIPAVTAGGPAKVALVVNPDDDLLDTLCGVPLDMLQLHGAESPARAAEIRVRTGLPVMKAIGVAGPDDLAAINRYVPAVDQILIDAKPPADGDLPGGNGLSFDWRLIEGYTWKCPWMLAGGLAPGNVAKAMHLTGATQVDVSSGVERGPGIKDEDLIRAFLKAVDETAAGMTPGS